MTGSFRLWQDQEVWRCSRSEQRIEIGDAAFVYTDRHSRRVSTILGYPMHLLAKD